MALKHFYYFINIFNIYGHWKTSIVQNMNKKYFMKKFVLNCVVNDDFLFDFFEKCKIMLTIFILLDMNCKNTFFELVL